MPSSASHSIHPRVRLKGEKKNTANPSSRAKRWSAQRAGILAHLETHPGDHMSRSRVSTINAAIGAM